jgi:Ca-activated chloride channel family protein
MRSKLLTTALLAASVLIAPAAHSAGMILIDPIPGMPMRPIMAPVPVTHVPGHPVRPVVLKGTITAGLRLQDADVKVDIADQVAKTYITQTFVNDTDQQLAGTYLFPLPDDTTFSSFSLHIDGKPIEGKILEANEARQTYEEIVRRLIDPGLLEYADYKTVRARIFPIPAHGTKKVELEYTQLLRAENGMLKYRFPLKTENATVADNIKVNVKLNSKQDIRTIWSPSHNIETKRDGEHIAKVSYAAQDVLPDKDFFLYYSISDKDMSANVLSNKSVGEDGYFLLTLTPPMQTKEVVAKDVVLVADSSGSMQGERMEQNKKALKYLINSLGADDKFSIVQFNTDVDSFKPTLVQATAENKKAAETFVDELEARGGTNIGDALKTGVTMLGQVDVKRPAYMVLMTDGEPTVGETTVPGLLKSINSKRDVRLFDFGVGFDVNTRLLNQLAEEHHGTAQYVQPEENLETALSDFSQKIKSPVLSDVKVEYDGVQVKDIYPRDVKDIFAGSQLLVLGRYKGSGGGKVKLSGTVNGSSKEYSFPVNFAEQDAAHTYLPRLWAMRRIGHLTEVAKDNGDNKEVVDEIIALSKKYGIISQYTSFLVTDPNEQNAHGQAIGATVPGAFNVRTGRARIGSTLGAPGIAGLPQSNMGRFMQAPQQMMLEDRAASGAGGGFAKTSGRSTTAVHGSLGALKPQARMMAAMPIPPMPSASPSFRRDDLRNGGKEVLVPTDSGFDANDFISSNLKNESGEAAVRREKKLAALNKDVAISSDDQEGGVKSVEDKTFYLRDGEWVDSSYDAAKSPKPIEITFGTKEYFELLKQPGLSKYLAVGKQMLVEFSGKVYRITYKESA